MESSALNAAHEKIRRAEALTREGKFEEAAECHEKVADVLNEVHSQLSESLIDRKTSGKKLIPLVSSLQSLMTLESLELQRDYHTRQSEVVRMKQAQFEEYKNTLEAQQRNLLNTLMPKAPEKESSSVAVEKYEGGSLKQAIFQMIEEQDGLLNSILVSDDDPYKHPKDAGMVIEELRTVNNHLRTLVGNLLSQLESKEQEVQMLTEKIKIMSSDTDVRPNSSHSTRLAPLPPLAPLDMPQFDFNSS